MKDEVFSSSKYFGLIAQCSLNFIDSPEYEKVVQTLFECYKRGGTVFTMGCGGSASTATHFAADLAKTVMVNGKPGFKAISLVDNIPLVSAWTNDKGWGSIFAGQLEQWLTKDDVLVGFSVHGGSKRGDEAGPWSQNLVSAVKLARERKAKIIGFSGFDGGTMQEMADACFTIPTNNELYGTPLIEAMHVVIHHSLIFDLKQSMKLPNLTVGVSSPRLRRERNPSEAKTLRSSAGSRLRFSRRGIKQIHNTNAKKRIA